MNNENRLNYKNLETRCFLDKIIDCNVNEEYFFLNCSKVLSSICVTSERYCFKLLPLLVADNLIFYGDHKRTIIARVHSGCWDFSSFCKYLLTLVCIMTITLWTADDTLL